jgi:hypothetical protein
VEQMPELEHPVGEPQRRARVSLSPGCPAPTPSSPLVTEGDQCDALPKAYFSHLSRLQSETRKIRDRSHALAIESGWRDDTALAFVKRFV